MLKKREHYILDINIHMDAVAVNLIADTRDIVYHNLPCSQCVEVTLPDVMS